MARRIDIVPNQGQWQIKSEGQTLATAARKTDAVQRGRQEAQRSQPASLRIHGRNGRIQEERSYPRTLGRTGRG